MRVEKDFSEHIGGIGRCLAIAGIALLIAAPGVAVDVSVDCDNPGVADFDTIGSAIGSLDPDVGNTITVVGTCAELVGIHNFNGLTIQGPFPGTATVSGIGGFTVFHITQSTNIRLRDLAIDGAGALFFGVFVSDSDLRMTNASIFGAVGDPVDELGVGLLANNQSDIRLGGRNPGDDVTVHSNEIGLLVLGDSSLNLDGQVTIENNSEDAAIWVDSRGGGNGYDLGNTIRNNGFGLGVSTSDRVSFRGRHLIENNGPYGAGFIRAQRGDFAAFRDQLGNLHGAAIQGHDVWGILAISSEVGLFGPRDDPPVHLVTGNGTDPVTFDSGIFALRPSSLLVRSAVISNNVGPGVLVRGGAYANLFNVDILNNSGAGVRIEQNSTAEMGTFSFVGDPIAADATFSGNGGSAIDCDTTSVLYGDTNGISPITCGGAVGGGGQPPGGGGGPPSGPQALENRLENQQRRIERALERTMYEVLKVRGLVPQQ